MPILSDRSRSRTLPFRLPHEPHVASLRISGHDFTMTVWGPQQWHLIPDGQRPGDAREMSGGAWYTLNPTTSSS